MTTRLAIDALRSAARAGRATSARDCPSRYAPTRAPGPADTAETADTLSMAFLVVLERLSPVERAVFLLHDVFGYNHAEVAAIVDKSEAIA